MLAPDAQAALDAIYKGAKPADLESDVLDFKEESSDRGETERSLTDACVCFANGRGGTIIVGVADRLSGPCAFVGAQLPAVEVRQRVHELTEPRLLIEAEAVDYRGHGLLVLRVPEGLEVYATTRGRATRRLGRDCLTLRPMDVTRLSEERRGIDWSSQESGRRMDEVAPLALATARELLSNSVDAGRRQYARMSDRDLLTLLGVLAAHGTLNNAGALLLCRRDVANPVAVYQYRRTPGGEPTVIERLETPLLLTFSRLMELIDARQGITPVNLPDGQQLQIKDFPDVPVRESTVNALIHGDHRLGSPIQIEHSPAVFSVRSPGPLVAGITPANIITHSSKPRYPVLARAVRVLGLAEEVGQGIDRMYREMIAAGKEVPQIEESYDEVRVALLGGAPNTRITKYIATLPTEERQDTDTLLTIVRLCNKKTVTAQEMAPVMQRRVEEAEESLRRLSSEAIAMLERTRESARRAFPTYRFRGPALQALGRAVRYQRRTWDEIDRKVVEHVEDYGKINNRTLQRLFDVDVYQARSMLADLVQREVLVKRSGAERGPSVEYAPGDKFPGKGRQARKRESDDGTSGQPSLL